MLGGVLLSFTGVEALFADLGAFSRRAIQLSWLCYTFPCLLLAYIGQAAYIRFVLACGRIEARLHTEILTFRTVSTQELTRIPFSMPLPRGCFTRH